MRLQPAVLAVLLSACSGSVIVDPSPDAADASTPMADDGGAVGPDAAKPADVGPAPIDAALIADASATPGDASEVAADASQPFDAGAGLDAGSGGFVISVPLSLDRTEVHLGETLHGTVTYQNTSAAPISIQRIVIAGRPPGPVQYLDFVPEQPATTVQPGQSITLAASREFVPGDLLGTWRSYATHRDADGVWHDGPETTFSVLEASIADAGTIDAGGIGKDAASTGPDASAATGPSIGTNLSGMEWARPGLRYGQSTLPNLNYTVPREPDVAWLAANGFTKNRLPIQWELLQPMLHDTVANAAAKAAIGEPGVFHEAYASYITDVLDAHASHGIKVIIDLHNYCRYQDFRYQADGSVRGLTVPTNPLLRPYTTDGSQVQVRICATANGATLKIANFTDFWRRAALRWKDHPGLGGYGLMNEPHDLPAPGGTEESYGNEDLTILPAFEQAAIDAIRAVDPTTPIYVSGNGWDSAMGLGTQNPGFPLAGANLVYEVHLYLDAFSNGFAFDYDTEVAKNYSAGLGSFPIDLDTGVKRLKIATDWAGTKGVKLALTEIGMPLDDARWEEMFRRTVDFGHLQGVELYSWMGGSHWPIHNYAINHVPGWHQHKTLEPSVSGPLKASAGVGKATLYDDGAGDAASGSSVTVTVHARGNLASPRTLTVTSDNGGTLSKSTLVIPAGANGQDSFTFSPGANRVTTLTYSDAQGGQVPPPRKVYSLSDPVAHASTNLTDAAMAILAKYGAGKWELADGYTDYLPGAAPSAAGQPIRAVSDSGFASSLGNAMEMLNWVNRENAVVDTMVPPVMGASGGKKYANFSAENTWGLWCKKSAPMAGVQEHPRNRVPYDLQDAHFVVAAVRVPNTWAGGVVFQASMAEELHTSELTFSGGKPQARWIDKDGQTVELTSAAGLAANTPAVIALTSRPGAQSLRVNSGVVGSAWASFAPSVFNQLLIGWGFLSYYPRESFGGDVYAVVAGKGAPTTAELSVLERYLATTAGFSL